MKNQLLIFLLLCASAVSCLNISDAVSYTTVQMTVLPYEEIDPSRTPVPGVSVYLENIGNGATYRTETGADGKAVFPAVLGRYRVVARREAEVPGQGGGLEKVIYVGARDNIRVDNQDLELPLPLFETAPSTLVITEAYFGGCKKLPYEGDYQSDQYLLLHNNSAEDQYLDSLCVGCLAPYNSSATNHWVKPGPDGGLVYEDYAPIIQAVWQFPGNGTNFVLHPGEDAVLCFRGAIDHTRQFPLSVNLDKSDYFVTYDIQNFPNPTYHPAPGPNIRADHYLIMVKKMGIANAYTISVNSPALVIFRTKGITVQDFVEDESNIEQVPNSQDKVVKLPWEWIVDGAEAFVASSNNNIKRLHPRVDGGYVTFSQSFLGHTIFRRKDDIMSAQSGYEVLYDTNNSSFDFYEREVQSLHE